MYIWYDILVVPARGGAEVALGIHHKTFHIYRTCMGRAPAKLVRARCVCDCVALLPSRNMTCVRPPCTARPREVSLHTSQFRLHSLHFKSYTLSHIIKLHCSNFFHTATFLHREAFTKRSFSTKLVHREARSFCTQSFYTETNLHTAHFDTEVKVSHAEAFTHRSFYTEKVSHACVALLPSNKTTCVRPPCTARPREDFLRASAELSFSCHLRNFSSFFSK